ncbi:hypothetical protein EJD97_007989 [Solanum chilense]|uniref:DCD domain-containing protein n=1 Tax=Solanum chilense TaxID=4083 RepID=A0A6N2BQW5_SOLCI|nr:hypothetical protein EJD97_007989 [Solanum chilense]
MDGMNTYWQFEDELRGQSKVSEDHTWTTGTVKLAEQLRSKGERVNNLDLSKSSAESRFRVYLGLQEDNKWENQYRNMLNFDSKITDNTTKGSFSNDIHNVNSVCPKSNVNSLGNMSFSKFSSNHTNDASSYGNNKNTESINGNNAVDKRFKTLPAAETLPRNEVLGGYIFVCNNDTMQEDLKRQLFGLPPRYKDSVRAITPGLPLFLYNYTTHQLHGIFEATSFGGSNIDPTAWEDKKCKGESRFPAQVKIRIRKLGRALEEDAFRPVLHHYDGPKFRLELSVPETLDLMDLFENTSVFAPI